MSERINAAHRLEQVLRVAADSPDTVSTVETWTQVFSITGPGAQTVAVKVVRMVGLLREEMREVRLKMSDTSVRPQQYEPAFDNISDALDIQSLSSQWRVYKQHLTPEVLGSVSWCADTLPNEEEIIESAAQRELEVELQRFATAVVDGSLPDYVKSFVLRQVDIIEQAIREYPVIGAKAFRHSTVECFFDLSENRDIYLKHSESEEIDKLREFWGRMQNMAEKAGPWFAIAQAAARLGELMGG